MRKAGGHCTFTFLLSFFLFQAAGQDQAALFGDSAWTTHFQFTGIFQAHPSFHTTYRGQNSLSSEKEKAFSITSTLFIGRALWRGASFYFNPEMAGGRGLSSTLGVAGFPNGETFRIGNPDPTIYVGRLFYRQYIALHHSAWVDKPSDVNQVQEKIPVSRLTINAGKFGLADFFDANPVSHDPRSDFMNWSLMNNGAYDYAANTRGYTVGLVIEYIEPGWAIRAGTALVPTYANGPYLDHNYFKSNSETVELEKNFTIHQLPGTVRLLGYFNVSKAPNYDALVQAKVDGTDSSLDAIYGKQYGGKKIGFGLNADQLLSKYVHAFVRLGWNDGKTATWAFAEIDNTLSGGIKILGELWKRKADDIGLALVSNGISSNHRNFLNAGGYGFMIGDGKLPNYGREGIMEAFYQAKILNFLWGTIDYQFIANPAYNTDRGPAHVFSARVHVEF